MPAPVMAVSLACLFPGARICGFISIGGVMVAAAMFLCQCLEFSYGMLPATVPGGSRVHLNQVLDGKIFGGA